MRRASRGGGSHSDSRRVRVPVKVTRVFPVRPTPEPRPDVNNNETRFWRKPEDPPEPETTFSFLYKLPPISSGFALLQVFLYFFREYFQVFKEEDICASSDNVIKQGQYWRLFVAQFFHFMKIPIYFNIITLMTLGGKLEKKIKFLPYFLLTFAMSVLSNLFYVALSDRMCASNSANEFTLGFSTTLFALRMVYIFTMDRDSSEGKEDPCLLFGFIPVHLPPSIVNWHPLIETIFFDVVIIGRCLASTVSGMFAAFIFPMLMKHYRQHIMLPLQAPPRSPNVRPRPPDPDLAADRNANISINYNSQFN